MDNPTNRPEKREQVSPVRGKAYQRPELKKHGKLKSTASQTTVYTYTYTYIT